MAMGMISKLFVFMIVINSLVAFVGGAGLLGENARVNKAQDYINDLQTQSLEATAETDATSGITILDYFNPLNYSWVRKLLGIVTGFFVDPILMFGALPAPLSNMFRLLYAVLEVLAIGGFARGVVA